jgi:hypothetical protein
MTLAGDDPRLVFLSDNHLTSRPYHSLRHSPDCQQKSANTWEKAALGSPWTAASERRSLSPGEPPTLHVVANDVVQAVERVQADVVAGRTLSHEEVDRALRRKWLRGGAG